MNASLHREERILKRIFVVCLFAFIGLMSLPIWAASPVNNYVWDGLNWVPLAGSASGSVVTISGCATRVVSPAAESNRALSVVASKLCSITATVGATSGYLLVFDAIAAPADGAVTPIYCVPIISNGTNGAVGVSWPAGASLTGATGLAVAFSTTGCFTKTASATASFSAMVQ